MVGVVGVAGELLRGSRRLLGGGGVPHGGYHPFLRLRARLRTMCAMVYNFGVPHLRNVLAALLAMGSVMLPGVATAQRPLRFSHVTVRDGLSNNSVFSILQDSLGFMWFGTFSGLNRYDGREIRTYRPEPLDRTSLSGSIVFAVLEDSQRRLWIGTEGGLNRYDYDSDSFHTFQPNPNDPTAMPSDDIFSLAEAADGSIWIGTADAGIAILDTDAMRFRRMTAGSTDGLESDVIRSLRRDRRGRMWIGTTNGLSLYNGTEVTAHYLEGHTVRDVFEDSRGEIWVGTEEAGLLRVVRETTPRFESIVSGVAVRTIHEDTAGRLWIGTERNGLAIVEATGAIRDVRHDSGEDRSLGSNFVRDIYVDRSGLVWVATRGGGLSRYNPRSAGFEYVLDGEYAPRQIMEDEDGTLWIATDGHGIYRVYGDRYDRLVHRPGDPSSLGERPHLRPCRRSAGIRVDRDRRRRTGSIEPHYR